MSKIRCQSTIRAKHQIVICVRYHVEHAPNDLKLYYPKLLILKAHNGTQSRNIEHAQSDNLLTY